MKMALLVSLPNFQGLETATGGRLIVLGRELGVSCSCASGNCSPAPLRLCCLIQHSDS